MIAVPAKSFHDSRAGQQNLRHHVFSVPGFSTGYFNGGIRRTSDPIKRVHSYDRRIKQVIGELPADLSEKLTSITRIREFGKNEYLLSAGQLCQHIYFIERGAARNFALVNGKEVTTGFTFAGQITTSFRSQTRQEPSEEYIQALMPTTVHQTDFRQFSVLKKQDQRLAELDVLILESYAGWLEERLFAFQTQTAEERYQLLIQQEPQLLQKISLTHIASYLGINLGSLSRIRAKR
ncbi:MAG: Crp/Fnr family transcriptional regulator [Ferruginibacter sp.]|nr:Crp/Fnr family transcriptional regulator [Cytophagales bacterium]